MPQPRTSRNSKKAWAAKPLPLLAFILTSLILITTPNSANATNTTQHHVYEVYAGGLHVVRATLDITLTPKNRYDIVLKAKTNGFLAKLIPWKGTFESHGWILDNNKFQPETHKSTTSWRDEIDIKEYLYAKNGDFKSLKITDEYSEGQHRDVEKDLTDQTTDALTATLQTLFDYTQNNECKGQTEVFDGKRRFKQEFHHQGTAMLKASKYNIFNGETAKCTLEVTPIAGAWHKKPRGWLSIQEQGRKRGTMPTLWIGKQESTQLAIPAKIQIKTAYGTLLMHLKE